MLNVNPELEQNLVALAQERGMTVEALLREFVGQVQAAVAPQSAEERARAFLTWADSFPDTPLLSDEAISRASMYPDRW